MSNPTFKQAFASEVFHFNKSPRSTVLSHIALVVLFTVGVGYPVLTINGVGFVTALILAPVVGIAVQLLLLTVLALMSVYESRSK